MDGGRRGRAGGQGDGVVVHMRKEVFNAVSPQLLLLWGQNVSCVVTVQCHLLCGRFSLRDHSNIEHYGEVKACIFKTSNKY